MNIDPNNVETRPNMVLTRFLYPKDEVKISLLLALIQKKSVNECLFWASELIYSGFIDDITQLLWSIYYDFYAQHNPNLMKKVSISLKKLSENNIEPLFNLLKTMRTRPATDNVFSLRISQTPTKYNIYKGRVPKWLLKYPSKQRQLLRAICDYDWNKIIMYIRSKIDDPKMLIKSILDVMIEKNMINLKDSPYELPNIDELWNNYGYNDEFHIILALIVSLITPDEKIDFSAMTIKLNAVETDFVNYLNGPITVNTNPNYPTEFAYDMLLRKRIFAINPYVSAFEIIRQQKNKLELETVRGFVDEIGVYWAYHCSQTPYWINIFNTLNGIVNNRGELIFHGDDYEERFRLFDLNHAYLYNLDEHFMKDMWIGTCSNVSVKKDTNENVDGMVDGMVDGVVDGVVDVVDLMENIFGNDEKELRIEFDDLLMSNKKQNYPEAGTPSRTRLAQQDVGMGKENSSTSQNSFDFTLLNKILDSV